MEKLGFQSPPVVIRSASIHLQSLWPESASSVHQIIHCLKSKASIPSTHPLVKKLLFLLLISLFLLPSCGVKEDWQTSTILVFDTLCEISIFSSSSLFKSAEKEIYTLFSEVESHFAPGSDDLSSTMVIRLYQRAKEVHQDSGGCFDITVAPLSQAWGFLSKNYVVPSPEHIQSLLTKIGMEKIKEENGALILSPGMQLDWGGIAKGLAIDLASQILREMGIARGFINAGGDLYCWGTNPENDPWKVGIKHPRKNGYLGVLSISQLGAATTGDYQRYFIRDDVRYHHVFDPRSGYPSQGKQSVTVCGPETLLCDALSTALFVCEKPEEILNKYPGYGAIIVDAEGNLSYAGKMYDFQPFK